MSSRELILSRVRQALATPSHRHAETQVLPTPEAIAAAMPAVPTDLAGQIQLFAACSEKLKTRFVRAANMQAAAEILAEIGRGENWTSAVCQDHPLVEAAIATASFARVRPGTDPQAMAACQGGVTTALALVAQTGSVLVTPAHAGGRTASVLPPHHVVIATPDLFVSDLLSAYARLRDAHGSAWPSFASLITGPSRTGDVERILVLGAHGPKQLTVILAESN